jgi:hypothetical protein
MSDQSEALRVPVRLCLAALLCVAVTMWRLSDPLGEVASATSTLDQDGCGAVPWLRLGLCHGIIRLALIRDPGAAAAIVQTISDAGKADAAKTSIRLDYFFIPAYVALLGFLGLIAARLAEPLGFARLIPWLCLVVGLQLGAGVLDGLENVGLFAMLVGRDIPGLPGGVPAWTFWAATAKWYLVTLGFLVPVGALAVMLLLDRRERSGVIAQPAPAAP